MQFEKKHLLNQVVNISDTNMRPSEAWLAEARPNSTMILSTAAIHRKNICSQPQIVRLCLNLD